MIIYRMVPFRQIMYILMLTAGFHQLIVAIIILLDDVAKMWWENETDISQILSNVEKDAIEKKQLFYSFFPIFLTYASKRHSPIIFLLEIKKCEQK